MSMNGVMASSATSYFISFSSLVKNCGETKTNEEKSEEKWRINTITTAGEAGGQTERSLKAVPGVGITSHEVGEGNVCVPQSVGLLYERQGCVVLCDSGQAGVWMWWGKGD